MIKRLLEDIERLNFRDYSEMQFNLYEDEEVYSAEVVFDEDALIIGREDKRFEIFLYNINHQELQIY